MIVKNCDISKCINDTLEVAAKEIEKDIYPFQRKQYQVDYNDGIRRLAEKIRNLKIYEND